MEHYLRDTDFLTELCSQREREVFARVTSLNLEDKPLEQLEGKVTNGSINIDGASAVRRTCSLSMVTESLDINEYYWGLKTRIKIEIGLKNNLKKYQNHPIIWFPMGIYLISGFSLSQSTTGLTININGKDKMCILNGEMGGILMAPTDFGKMETYDEAGNRKVEKIPVKQIIGDMIHQYSNEPYSKIFVQDIEDFGLKLQTWRGAEPCYFYLQSLEAGGRAPLQMSLNSNDMVVINEGTDNNPKIVAATLKQLDNYDQQQYFVGGGNDLTNELATTPVYFYKGDRNNQPRLDDQNNFVGSNTLENFSDSPSYIKKVEYGNTIGYTITDLVYPEDLIANAGETIASVLDKIKNMLGDFEYFYDIDGNFIFRKQKAYAETYNAQNIFDLETNKTLQTVVDENTTIEYDQSLYLIASATDNIDFKFNNLELITNISNNPAIGNVKNDFTVWGNKKSVSGASVPIHMRYAIDKKPEEYHSIELTPARAAMLLRCYPELFPIQDGEFDTIAISRLISQHRGGDFYYKMPERMKQQVIAYREMYLQPYFKYFKSKLPKAKQIILDNAINSNDFDKNNYTVRFSNNDSIQLWSETDLKEFEDKLLDLTIFLNPSAATITYKSNDSQTNKYFSLIEKVQALDTYLISYSYAKNKRGSQYTEEYSAFLNGTEDTNNNGLKSFVNSYQSVRNNLYDWRELLYQMAKDYRSFNQIDEFTAWVEEANPYTCIAGKTGYEQYYIDMEGFWRQIYDKSWHDVKWNDKLEEGRIYRLRDESNNPEEGQFLQYSIKNIKTDVVKNNTTIEAPIPDIDIYTLGSEKGTNNKYTKIGSLYEIIENDYKLMEPIIQRYIIDEWEETHPEGNYRLFGLTKNGSNYLEQNTLYLQDPHTQAKNAVTGKYNIVNSLEEQLHTTARPYYHKGEYDDNKNATGELTYLSNSKIPLWTGIGAKTENFCKILLDADTSDLDYLEAFRVLYNSGPKPSKDKRQEILNKLKELGQLFVSDEVSDMTIYQIGLIALVLRKENIVANLTSDGYKSIIKKYFMKVLGEYVYGYRIGINNSINSFLCKSYNPASALATAANTCFLFGITSLGHNFVDKNLTINNFVEQDFEEYKSPIGVDDDAVQAQKAILSFFNLFAELGNLNGDNKFNIEDFKTFITYLLEKGDNNINSQYKNYYSQYICYGSTKRADIGIFLKEFYFRVTNDFAICNKLQIDDFHSHLFSIITQQIFFDVIKTYYKGTWRTWLKPFVWSRLLKPFFDKLNSLGLTRQADEIYEDKNIDLNNDSTDSDKQKAQALINSIQRLAQTYTYPFFDVDGNGTFGIMDIQELVKLAANKSSLENISEKIKELISFADDFDILPFNLVRFIYFMYILNIATGIDDTGEGTSDLDNNVQISETYNGLSNIIKLWILILTPYAIESVKSSSTNRTPYYVKEKILKWTYGGAQDNFRETVLQILGGIYNDGDGTDKDFWIQCQIPTTTAAGALKTSEQIMAQYVFRDIDNPISKYEYYIASQLVSQDSTKGDVDKDGKITAKDARIALKLANNMYENHGQLDRAKIVMEDARKAAEEG